MRLSEAIAWGELSLAAYRENIGEGAAPAIRTLLDAARQWDEFPSDEDVEDAAAEEIAYEGRLWMDLGEPEKQYRRDKIRAALEAVKETGEPE